MFVQRVNNNILHPASFDLSPPCYGGGHAQPLHPGMPSNYRVPIPLPGLRYNFGLHPNGQTPYGLLPGYGPPNSLPGVSLSLHFHCFAFLVDLSTSFLCCKIIIKN